MDSNTPDYETDLGSIQIAPEVIATIAGVAASRITGVAGMSGSIGGGIAKLLGRKNLTKGVKVQLDQHVANIDISIIIEYGHRIPELAHSVQASVTQAIHSMTALEVKVVNVHILDVHFQAKEAVSEDETTVHHG